MDHISSSSSFTIIYNYNHSELKKISTNATSYSQRISCKYKAVLLPHHRPRLERSPIPSLKVTPKEVQQINHKTLKSPYSSFESIFLIAKTFPFTAFVNTIDSPLSPSVDPERVFAGNFAPVNELAATECQVIDGELPVSLNGVYVRNGPNPQYVPRGRPLHFFEGDGMLHSVQLSEGRAVYSCRHVKTYKYMLERETGSPVFPNILSGIYGLAGIVRFIISVVRVLIWQINLMKGFGSANTSLAFFSQKLLALCESDLPYIIHLTKEGDIETLGRWDFDKKLFANMTAHPKVDIATKEAFAFRCSLMFPYLTYFWFDENGVKQKEVPILSINQSTFIHDFAITKNFAIFPETEVVVSPAKAMLGRGMPVVFEPAKVPRIGVISRYATSDAEMKWFKVPGFNAMHVLNAWENGRDEIVVVATNATSVENIFSRIDKVHFSLQKIRINSKTGDVSVTTLSTRNLELGTINPSYMGKRNRYGYLGIEDEVPKMSGVVKIDLETESEVSNRFYGAGCFGGEPLFVARDGAESLESEEDDGYVVTYIHDENAGESKFLVMDAKSPNLDLVAAVKLPERVPYGFHGLFINARNL